MLALLGLHSVQVTSLLGWSGSVDECVDAPANNGPDPRAENGTGAA
jgi:hypothetical protein